MNIRSKLTIQFVLIVGFITLLFSIGVYMLSAKYRQVDYISRLEQKANSTGKLLFEVSQVDSNLMRIIDKNVLSLYQDQVIIFNQEKHVLYSVSNWKNDFSLDKKIVEKIREKETYHVAYDKRDYIGLTFSSKEGNIYIVTSAYDIYGWRKINNLRLIMVVIYPIIILIALISGLFFSKRALDPISNVITQVNEISGASLYLRVDEGNGTDEIAKLAITFNKMLSRLEQAFAMQKSFISNASHELRTPLTIILGEVELAGMNPEVDPNSNRIYIKIGDEIKRMMTLTNNLLQLAVISSDRKHVPFSVIRMDELILESRLESVVKFPGSTVNIEFENLPEDEKDILLDGNYSLMISAFKNLISNGLKYSNNPFVTVSLLISKDLFTIKFRDYGYGISAEDELNIFEPFFRGKNVTGKEGNGLGLALVKRIIEIHNGTITIEKNPDIGCTFTVVLPK